MPLVRRTRATLRSAEFGFFGVCGVHAGAHTATLRRALEGRRLALGGLGCAALADQLLDGGHADLSGCFGRIGATCATATALTGAESGHATANADRRTTDAPGTAATVD